MVYRAATLSERRAREVLTLQIIYKKMARIRDQVNTAGDISPEALSNYMIQHMCLEQVLREAEKVLLEYRHPV